MLIVWYSATPTECGENDAPPYVAIVTAHHVNLRAGPHINYETLGQISSPTEVVVRAEQYSWFSIDLPPTSQCFVHESLVLRQGNTGLISADRVNVRARANLSASVLSQLNTGNRVTILEHEGEWYRIAPPVNARGWISNQYLKYLHPLSMSREVQAVAPTDPPAVSKTPTLLGQHSPPRPPTPDHLVVKIPVTDTRTLQPLLDITKTASDPVPSTLSQSMPEAKTIDEPSDNIALVVEPEMLSASIIETVDATPKPTATSRESAFGVVVDLGRVRNRRGASHKLESLTGDVLYWLRCDQVDLNTLIYHRVAVTGELHPDRSHPQVLTVHSIEPQQSATPTIEVGERPKLTSPSSI